MFSTNMRDILRETKQELEIDDLTTGLGGPGDRRIKLEETEQLHIPVQGKRATAAAVAPVNPYAGLTNSGKRKRTQETESQANGNTTSLPHPHAPRNAGKARSKKPPSPGVLVATRGFQRYGRSDVVNLDYVITLIRQIENASLDKDLPELFNKLRKRIHQIEFTNNLCEDLVRDSKLLEGRGLSKIFSSHVVDYPYDLVDDSLVLYQKWLKGLCDPHLLHGIEFKNRVQPNGKTYKSRNLEPNYPYKVSAHFVGSGDLINGQWWPLQICAIRDGAHGEYEAGICGKKGKGVFSIVVGSSGYSDEDNGDTIKYCGTSGALRTETASTKLMMESHILRNPVRVIRSGVATNKKKTVYQPSKGLRYDGLYEVVGDEVLDVETAMHRFTLRRLDGQHPIRYQGVEARPTPEECYAYDSIREKLGFKN